MSVLDGKTAIVSGAARGLGEAFARALAENGADAVIFDIDEGVLDVASHMRETTGQKVVGLVADVSRRGDVERVTATAAERFGGVDVLVNNAGTRRETPVDAPWADVVADWDYIMDPNLKGVLMLSRACIPQMKGRENANIFHVSTYYVLPAHSGGTNPPNTDLYNASKWALNAFTDSWSAYLAEAGIRVNGLCMGATDTPMLRALFDDGQLPDELKQVVMQPEQIAGQMLAVIREGPSGRSGENIGAWVEQPLDLPPRKAPHERITGINIRVESGAAP